MTERPSASQVLAEDLAAFADPAVRVEIRVSRGSSGAVATWTQDGNIRSAEFTFDDESLVPISVIHDDQEMTYRSFLAGASMADLRALARNTANVIATVSPPYVRLQGRNLDTLDNESDAEALIEEAATSRGDQTTLVFLSAGAGMGKTSLLRELVRRKASEYLRGESEALWVYVDAQGRRLAQLDEAIAAELDDLRARFPYHAASALVRSGAMVLVVDGFDELIGSVGSYDEAFSSLAEFIASLYGSGCIVAAARSAYYEQEFLTRANSKLVAASDSWGLRGIRLLEWSTVLRRSFIEQFVLLRGGRRAAGADTADRIEHVLQSPEVAEVGTRPLFVSRTAEIVLDYELPAGVSLLDRLVAAYIQREVQDKLRAPSGAPMLTEEQYRDLLRELAAEMWKQESRELTRGSVREIGRLVGEILEIDNASLDEIVSRLPYAALLSEGATPGSVAFEHDVFYSSFLAEPVGKIWLSGDGKALGRMLRRGRLPEEAALLVADRLGDASLQLLADTLHDAIRANDSDREQIRRNAGNLLAARLRNANVADLRVRDLAFTDIPLGCCHISDCSFSRCDFSGTDLTSSVFLRCDAEGVKFDRVIVSSETRLGFSGIGPEDFYGLTVRTESAERLMFAPPDIMDALVSVELPAAMADWSVRPVQEEVVELLERLCRVYLKTNSLTEDDEVEMTSIVRDRNWNDLRRVLLESGVISMQTKSASGRKIFLKRHARSQDIMAGVDPQAEVPEVVRVLWDRLEEDFPQGRRAGRLVRR